MATMLLSLLKPLQQMVVLCKGVFGETFPVDFRDGLMDEYMSADRKRMHTSGVGTRLPLHLLPVILTTKCCCVC